ncbi:MAG: hypothetical protein K2N51_03355 [Lachnospiraceae bacterium]|nr:hypothetical protein [Lachnospiraceae bacterium]
MIELDDRLQKVKRDKEARDQYMTLQNLIEEERDEARAEGHAAGAAKGYARNIAIIRKKFDKGDDAAMTADMLEQETLYIENIYKLFQNNPEYTDLEIAEIVLRSGDK